MNDNAKKALFKEIMSCLGKCSAKNGTPDMGSIFDAIEPLENIINKTHKEIFLKFEIIWLVYQKIQKFLVEKQLREIKKRNLFELAHHKEWEPVAKTLVEFIETVPRKYAFYYRLPNITDSFFDDLRVSKDISFIRINAAQVLTNDHATFKPGLYLKIDVDGYCDGGKDASATLAANSKFKQFMYLSFLTNRLKFDRYKNKEDVYLKSIQFSDHETDKNFTNISGSENFAKFLNYIIIHSELHNTVKKAAEEPPKGFSALLTKKIPDFDGNYFPEKLITILESPESDNNTASLKNAMEWAFDSRMNTSDDTLSFVQLTVALEAVLGIDLVGDESKKGGVTERLADRCAYLIGNTFDERKKIRAEFVVFYDIRSTLIHGRSKRLKTNDSKHFHWGVETLDKVIHREIELFPDPVKERSLAHRKIFFETLTRLGKTEATKN